MSKRRKRAEYLPIVYPNAAGLDIGSCEIYACVLKLLFMDIYNG